MSRSLLFPPGAPPPRHPDDAHSTPDDDLGILTRATTAVASIEANRTSKDAAGLPVLLSTTQVAAYLDRTPATLRRWRSCGTLDPVRIGRGLFYRAGDVRNLVISRRVDAIAGSDPADEQFLLPLVASVADEEV